MQLDALRDLLKRATISEEHHTLMGTVMERIPSAESGLHDAFMSLLTGFEVRKEIRNLSAVPHTLGVVCIDSSP